MVRVLAGNRITLAGSIEKKLMEELLRDNGQPERKKRAVVKGWDRLATA